MEFDELLITTGVDALVRLVKEKQRIDLVDASSILNIPKETIEEWSRVLEEEGILRIEYRLARVYLIWIKPTDEEISTEKESFYTEKKGIEVEVEQFKQKINVQAGELTDLHKEFAEFYSKVYGKMESLEKMVAPLPASKSISESILSKHETELADVGREIEETRNAMANIKKELETLGIGREDKESAREIDKVDRMGSDLLALRQEMEVLKKKNAAQEMPTEISMPTVRDIKKKFETTQKEFAAIRSRNAQMRQDMISLHESSEVLKSVAESIMGQEDNIGNLHGEATELSEEVSKIIQRVNGLDTRVKQNVELLERLGDSVEVAKGVLKKFPSQEKVVQELEKVKSEEDSLVEKNAALAQLLEAVGGRQVTAKQFTELSRKIDEKSDEIRREIDVLETTLQDEKNTYLTFQKIKERIVPSMEGYQRQLEAMEQKITKIREESTAQIRNIKSDAQKLQETLKGGQTQDIMRVAEEIRDKKRMLDDIKTSLEELVMMSDNLNKRVTLLSREARLLEIRASGGSANPSPGGDEGDGADGTKVEEKAVRQKLELTQEEEMEFRKKREELKKLIQKLWED